MAVVRLGSGRCARRTKFNLGRNIMIAQCSRLQIELQAVVGTSPPSHYPLARTASRVARCGAARLKRTCIGIRWRQPGWCRHPQQVRTSPKLDHKTLRETDDTSNNMSRNLLYPHCCSSKRLRVTVAINSLPIYAYVCARNVRVGNAKGSSCRLRGRAATLRHGNGHDLHGCGSRRAFSAFSGACGRRNSGHGASPSLVV